MALATIVKTIRDFVTGDPVEVVLALFANGGTASLHALIDSNGALVDPATDQDLQAVHEGLQAIIAKQTPLQTLSP